MTGRSAKTMTAVVAGLVVAAAVVWLFVVPMLRFQDPAQPISTAAPATSPLLVPPLLSATANGDFAQFELSIGADSHEFFDGVETETLTYNGIGVLAPTL